jgi:uncharacterized protein (DUF934 family)
MPDVLHFDGPRFETDARELLGGLPGEHAAADGAVPLDAWLAQRATGQRPPAVWLAPDDDFTRLREDCAHLKLIALQFPKAADGRAYSIAAILRTQYGFRGELRAFGDIQIDQLFFMRRVGFDSAVLKPELRRAESLPPIRAALATFSERYQGAADEPLPLFKRRLLGAVSP